MFGQVTAEPYYSPDESKADLSFRSDLNVMGKKSVSVGK